LGLAVCAVTAGAATRGGFGVEWLGPEKILELYGGTELLALTVVTGGEWLTPRGTVGRPVIGEIEGGDEDGGVLAPGAVGELWLRRGADAPAAYRYIGATARAAADGWESLGEWHTSTRRATSTLPTARPT
jgi:bile acid-coenzyme A ligase